MQKACMFLFLYGKRKNYSLLVRDGKTGRGGTNSRHQFQIKKLTQTASSR